MTTVLTAPRPPVPAPDPAEAYRVVVARVWSLLDTPGHVTRAELTAALSALPRPPIEGAQP